MFRSQADIGHYGNAMGGETWKQEERSKENEAEERHKRLRKSKSNLIKKMSNLLKSTHLILCYILHQRYVLFFKTSFLQMILRFNRDYKVQETEYINMARLLRTLYCTLFKRLHKVQFIQVNKGYVKCFQFLGIYPCYPG